MKYPPQHHQEADFQNALLAISHFPLATVITAENDSIESSHFPLFHEDDGSNFGKLIGHLDIYNPQAEHLDGRLCSVIFHGPQSYISPSDYSSSQLPTWNYVKVHFRGRIFEITDQSAVRDSLITLTQRCETEQNFVLEPDNPKMKSYLPYIKGFEIRIESWEGKFKLSQDKSPQDYALAREALTVKNSEQNAVFLDALFMNHKTQKSTQNS